MCLILSKKTCTPLTEHQIHLPDPDSKVFRAGSTNVACVLCPEVFDLWKLESSSVMLRYVEDKAHEITHVATVKAVFFLI